MIRVRVLHTSDWHLGRTLHGHARAPEHQAFLDELVELCDSVDLVLISGDVFETANPPIEAEELFFDALARLGAGGSRAVVVIAGNHDSPDRLKAAAPLASRHGVWIIGRPADAAHTGPVELPGGVRLVHTAPSSVTLDLPVRATGEHQRAVVSALPYPSEARLRQLLSLRLEEQDRQRAYSRRVGAAFQQLAEHYTPGAVHLAMSHLAVRSCMPRSSERVLVGGAYQIEGSALPSAAQYVALGHLHLPQEVPDAPAVARYAGAPLAMRFSERDDPRVHTLVDVEPGQAPEITLEPVRAGRDLVVWEAASLEEVHHGIAEGLHEGAFIDLRVQVEAHLTHAELASLKALPRDIVAVRAVLPESSVTPILAPERRRELPVQDLFRAFYRDQTGDEPSAELVDLFVELAQPSLADRTPAPPAALPVSQAG